MEITSVNNEKVKEWVKLKNKKDRDQNKLFLIEGDHLVNIALEKNLVKALICLERTYDFEPTYIVSKNVMKKLSSQVSISPLMAVCSFTYGSSIIGNVLLLDDIQDPGNLGTIIRSCVAFNFQTLILSSKTVDLYNEKVIRASEGMLFKLNVIRTDLITIIPKLKEMGYNIIGTDVIKGIKVNNCQNEKLAIIIGNEGQGMQKSLKEKCDTLIKIPMSKECESLNAAVAASIIMSEVYDE